MRKNTTQIVQEKQLEGMMKRPIPKKKVGIIHLEMVRESRILYGMRRFSQPDEAVDIVRPLFAMADRELMLVMSLNTKLEPMAVEIAAVGGLNVCSVDVRNLFKHALLNNVAYYMGGWYPFCRMMRHEDIHIAPQAAIKCPCDEIFPFTGKLQKKVIGTRCMECR